MVEQDTRNVEVIVLTVVRYFKKLKFYFREDDG